MTSCCRSNRACVVIESVDGDIHSLVRAQEFSCVFHSRRDGINHPRSVSYTNSRDHRRYSRCACDTTELHDIIIHLPIDGFWFRKLGLLRKMDEVSLSATKPLPPNVQKCEL